MCNSKGSKIKVLLPVFCQSEVISDVQHKCGTQRLGMKSRTELCSEAKLSDYTVTHMVEERLPFHVARWKVPKRYATSEEFLKRQHWRNVGDAATNWHTAGSRTLQSDHGHRAYFDNIDGGITIFLVNLRELPWSSPESLISTWESRSGLYRNKYGKLYWKQMAFLRGFF